MTTITIRTNLLRKIAPYILFFFTVLSFLFTTPFLLYLFISLAILGFIFVNTTQLFSKERYLSYIEIFSSILLLIRLIMIYNQGLFYDIFIGFILINFVLFYVLNFSNYKTEDTNLLGIRKEREYTFRRRLKDDNEIEDDGEGLEEDTLDEKLEDESVEENELEEDEEEQLEDEELEDELQEDEEEVEEEEEVKVPVKKAKKEVVSKVQKSTPKKKK